MKTAQGYYNNGSFSLLTETPVKEGKFYIIFTEENVPMQAIEESFDDAFCLALADKHKAQYPVIADDDYTSLDTLAAEWGIELNES